MGCRIFLLLLFHSAAAIGQYDGKLDILSTRVEGQPIKFICSVQSSKIAGCSSPDLLVKTVFEKDNATICTVDYNLEKNNCPTSSGNLTYPCWCEQASNYINYIYDVTKADPSLHNGTWTCSKGCISTSNLSQTPFVINDTAGLNFVVIPVTTTTVSTSTARTSDPKPFDDDPKPSSDETTGIVLGVAIFIIVILIIAVVAFQWKGKRAKSPRLSPPPQPDPGPQYTTGASGVETGERNSNTEEYSEVDVALESEESAVDVSEDQRQDQQ